MRFRRRITETCERCGGPLLEIAMEKDDGRVTFRMCSPCEARWWERNGVRISRSEAVLHPPRR